jgi:hypothetical protein
VVVLTVIVLVPSLIETVTQNLSPIGVLARLALALFLIGSLVWFVTAVVLHYAHIQSRRDGQVEDDGV